MKWRAIIRKKKSSLPQTSPETDRQLALNRKLTLASNQLLAVAQQLIVTIDENQEHTQSVFAKATEMAELNRGAGEGLRAATQDIDSMDGRLEKIKGISAAMEQTGKTAGAVLPQSLEHISSVLSDIRRIHQSTEDTLDMVDELTGLSREIAGILDTVGGISRQSNLLALNAAIEASRAGEAGACFRVVAAEMRKLSNLSQNSVRNISDLVLKVQEAIANVNEKIRTNAAIVNQSLPKFGSIETHLHTIQSSFADLIVQSEKVNAGIVRERETASQIRQQMLELTEKSASAFQKVEQVHRDLDQQQQTTAGLNSLGTRLTNAAALLESMVAKGLDQLEIREELQQKIAGLLSRFKEKIAALKTLDSRECAPFLQQLLNEQTLLEAAWVNDAKGQFIHSIPPAGIANARAREWFTESIRGREYLSPPYISAITGQPCVTYATPVYDAAGSVIGVLGVDFTLE